MVICETRNQSLDDDVYVQLLWFCCGFVVETNIVGLWIWTSSSKDCEQQSKNNWVPKCDKGLRKFFVILVDGSLLTTYPLSIILFMACACLPVMTSCILILKNTPQTPGTQS